MEVLEEKSFPAITRALEILRERYKDQIERKENGHDCDGQNENEESIDEDSLFDSPQLLNITPIQQQQPEIIIKRNKFQGLSDRARILQRKQQKQQQQQKRGHDTINNNSSRLKLKALEKAITLCQQWSLLHSCFQKWKEYCTACARRKDKFLHILNQHFETDMFSLKFSYQVRRNCVRRYGKERLSQLYNAWRICRYYFYSWIRVTC